MPLLWGNVNTAVMGAGGITTHQAPFPVDRLSNQYSGGQELSGLPHVCPKGCRWRHIILRYRYCKGMML